MALRILRLFGFCGFVVRATLLGIFIAIFIAIGAFLRHFQRLKLSNLLGRHGNKFAVKLR